jgi:hypothetical protein
MACERCGAPCQGRRCAGCEQIDVCEARHGDSVDDSDETEDDPGWMVRQRDLSGDKASGQTTLAGDVVPEGGGE